MSSEEKHGKKNFWVLLTGLFLILMAVAVVVFALGNYIAIGFSFFVLMIGIALVMLGAIDLPHEKRPPEHHFHKEVTREIVKVRCRHCSTLNLETVTRCMHCGAGI